MAKSSRNLRVDRDGVRVFETDSGRRFEVRYVLALVAVVVVAAGAFLLRPSPAASPRPGRVAENAAEPAANEVAEVQTAQAAPVTRPKPQVRALHVARNLPAQPEAEPETAPKDQPEIDARDVILALQASGEKEGIAAFNPPGTNPPKSGIIVPEDYQLPEGYVRYYQATDDGQRLDPILMFSPDYQFVDAAGNPIELPEDMIVPPDLAPPGLPIRMLEIPKRRLH